VSRALVFGASGALGSAIVSRLAADGWSVDRAGRSAGAETDVVVDDGDWVERTTGLYDGVVWAQGVNGAGGVDAAPDSEYERLFAANVVFIARTLRTLVAAGRFARPARAVVVSSIWQIAARADKAAYVTSKAALAGFVPAAAADLAGRVSINAVLPGVIDTPMTRSQLSDEQLSRVQAATPGGALARPEHVAAAVAWLLSPGAAGVNAQSIVVDNGFTAVRGV
jgi:NAD(P)-dependent dehydrogenase (short-subunit alcohol dehydrogenase family)